MLRPWDLKITVDRGSTTPLHLQIAVAIAAAIVLGRLAPGNPLPGSRQLAEELSVNRKTAQVAYDELVAQGWLTMQPRHGTFVPACLPPKPFRSDAASPGGALEPVVRRPRSSPIPPPPRNDMIVFDDGAPDARLVPAAALARAYRGALQMLCRTNRLSDEHTLGYPALRRSIATMLNFNRGLSVSPDRICLTRGSQMAIFLAAGILAGPGDAVALEDPGYAQAREAFRAVGAEVIPVPVDEGGLDVDALERLCRQRRLCCVYLTPHHQYPTTVALAPERRRRLLNLADRCGFVIIEDDYDHEFHFAGPPLLPLASQHPEGNIVYIGSFSKLISPSLRCGYISAPEWFIRRVAQGVARIDRQGDPAMGLALSDLIESGEVQRHFHRTLKIYQERSRQFATLLEHHVGTAARFTMPHGGLAFWVIFEPPFGSLPFSAAARAAGVRLLPTRIFTGRRTGLRASRIGYASHSIPEIEEGMRRLGRVLWQGARGQPTANHDWDRTSEESVALPRVGAAR